MARLLRIAFASVAFIAPVAVLGCGAATPPSTKAMGDKMDGDKMGGDKMGGDKMGGDKMGGDKMGGDKMGDDKMSPATKMK